MSSGLASLMGPMSQGIGMVNSLPRGLQLDSNLFANLKELTARALDSGRVLFLPYCLFHMVLLCCAQSELAYCLLLSCSMYYFEWL